MKGTTMKKSEKADKARTESMSSNLLGPEGPEIEPSLLLRYLIKRFDEMLQTNDPTFPLALRGLALSSVAHDKDGYAELRSILIPPDQISRCREILEQTLLRTKDDGTLIDRGGEKVECLDEMTCRQVLLTALDEGERMVDEDSYEFAPIFQCIGWIALRCYPLRLEEYEKIWQSCAGDPRQAISAQLEILEIALDQKDVEETKK
jgi:hypothetical protein